MQGLAVIAAAILMVCVGVEGRTVANTTQTPISTSLTLCPPFYEVGADGLCVAVNDYVRKEIDSSRMRRQATGTTCPYCSLGVWDLYPNYDNCALFYYCLNGDIIPLDCREIVSDGTQTSPVTAYFNPITKRCESVVQASNNCLFRSYDLRVTG